MDTDELNRIVKKLNDARAISEWHFRDAVEELLESYSPDDEDFLGDDA